MPYPGPEWYVTVSLRTPPTYTEDDVHREILEGLASAIMLHDVIVVDVLSAEDPDGADEEA